jgi:hypothetical protein
MKLVSLWSAALAAALSAVFPAYAGNSEVIVNCDLTKEGRNFTPPTKDKPVQYVLLLSGYREIGEKVAGEVEPSKDEVKKIVVSTLSSQHYVATTKSMTTKPEILIVVHYGYANPELIDSDGFNPDNPQVVLNDRAMRGLVGGRALATMSPNEVGRSALLSAASDNRYFILVTAFDWAAAEKKEKKALWRARISIPSQRTSLQAVIPIMLKNAAPFLGRDTEFPRQFNVNDVPEGRVEAGPMTVVEDKKKEEVPAPPAPATEKKP